MSLTEENNFARGGILSPVRRLATLGKAAFDLLLPPRCPGSGEIVDTPGMISPAFWSQLSFVEAPFCATCGLPFGFAAPLGTLCAVCLDDPPDFDTARAGVVYNDASRQLVLDFKYGDKLYAIDSFMPWLMRAGADMLLETDIIVPVPLHPRRLWQRRFNQSALIAQKLAQRSGKMHLPDGLRRTKYTVPQKGLNRKERHLNVRGAFAVHPRHTAAIQGRTVMIVDDVFTSGATLNACARRLKKSGAARVFVLTLARVTREEF